MKNKRILKGWVVKLLILLNFLNFTLVCGEWTNTIMWIGFIVYTMLVLFISYKILKIGSVYDEIR